MRRRSTCWFAAGAILAMTLGFSSLVKAAPLAGLSAAIPAISTPEVSSSGTLPEKAYYYRRYYHRPYYHRRYYHRPYYHHRYYRRRFY